MTRTVYVVACKGGGYLGLRRYSYKHGQTSARGGVEYEHARVFLSETIAARNMDKGDKVVPCKMIGEPE